MLPAKALLLCITVVLSVVAFPSAVADPYNSLLVTGDSGDVGSVTFVDRVDGPGYVISVGLSMVSASAGACYSYSGIHWASNKIPVGYSISTGAGAPSGATGAIQAGFQVWNHAGGTPFWFSGGGNSVSWGNIDGPGKILAVANVWYYAASKEIARASITFDKSEKWATDGRTKDAFDVQNVAAHEAGHWLMLNDVSCRDETMYRYAAPGETNKRTLGSGDIAGIQAIYGGTGPGPTPTGFSVTVTVTDSSGRAVSGATVYLDGTKKGTTDYRGKLVITGVSKGSHTVTVKKTGYQDGTQQVNVQRDTTVTIRLQPTPTGFTVILTLQDASGLRLVGWKVYLDGTYMGQTDRYGMLTIMNVSPGSHKFTLKSPTYATYYFTYFVYTNTRLTVTIRFTLVEVGASVLES